MVQDRSERIENSQVVAVPVASAAVGVTRAEVNKDFGVKPSLMLFGCALADLAWLGFQTATG